jgi:hypothetical protein
MEFPSFDLYGMYVGDTDAQDGYDEVTVVWEGALESITVWTSATTSPFDATRINFTAWHDNLEREASEYGSPSRLHVPQGLTEYSNYVLSQGGK